MPEDTQGQAVSCSPARGTLQKRIEPAFRRAPQSRCTLPSTGRPACIPPVPQATPSDAVRGSSLARVVRTSRGQPVLRLGLSSGPFPAFARLVPSGVPRGATTCHTRHPQDTATKLRRTAVTSLSLVVYRISTAALSGTQKRCHITGRVWHPLASAPAGASLHEAGGAQHKHLALSGSSVECGVGWCRSTATPHSTLSTPHSKTHRAHLAVGSIPVVASIAFAVEEAAAASHPSGAASSAI
jgi:hypothetical protein